MLLSRRRFLPFAASWWFRILLLGGMALCAPWAHSDAEPMEPLPVALPDRHPPVAPSGGYVGAQSCAECHQMEYRHWRDSQHAKAMQPATEQTVLGDFNDAPFTYADITSTFFRRDGKFMVRTDGPDGNLQDYEIAYTFGVYPLQQYLIGFPDGRYQALGIAWDSRPKEQGGQLWFHLYPDQNLTHKDPLHWTGLQQNWNYMCAECHSTNLRKNYDPKLNHFNTIWSEINVSCEACHGPSAAHLAWARKEGDWQKLNSTKGLAIALDERRGLRFQLRELAMQGLNLATATLNPQLGVLLNSQQATSGPPSGMPRSPGRELDLCARCHSRRGQFWGDYVFGKPLPDTHRLALLTPDLYYPDGQMKDEVFNHGSFLQSKMFTKGVSCGDCHEPHSGKLRAAGNQVCAQCHLAAKYESPRHHFHPTGSTGADCVACHAPATTYMVVDPRHDHSFRIPRPDLTVKLNVPNACNRCHQDQSARWAVEQVQRWYGQPLPGHQRFAEALHAGHTEAAGARELLRALLKDPNQPNIARASGAALLGERLDPAGFETLRSLLTDPDPLLRSAAARGLEALPPELKAQHLLPLLDDPVRQVRIDAARVLAAAPKEPLTEKQREAIQRGVDEYIAAEMTNADRPESYLNIGLVYSDQGRLDRAEAAYRAALDLQPTFTQAVVNLADLYRAQGRDSEGEKILRQALVRDPHNATANHALGLLLIRQKRLPEAMAVLGEAAKLDSDNPRYGYVYAVALNGTGQGEAAIRTLETVLAKHPNDRDTLMALVAFQRNAGHLDMARDYARRLAILEPDNPEARALLRQVGVKTP
ncbi:MAG: tetratricopeptide repeat protein [Candidatus Contendobacter sp.]|nr:tetratricopeptide repeat protein [Candidatus Contendobacter sp.]MDG4557101.1 tetratricopeptide repeat protein [Candidatus Contendobacter sp.]